jgi:hypothetical protein
MESGRKEEMTRRSLLLVALLLGSCSHGGIVVTTSSGLVRLDRTETRRYLEVEAYLWKRMKEVESIRIGITYRGLRMFFVEDGGISSPPPHRFVNILCPFIKIDVSFEGEDRARSFWPIPDDARVSAVTRSYFEPQYAD